MEPISRGDVWLANLDPTKGTEQSGTRPVLIVTADILNKIPTIDVFVVPMTRTPAPYRSRIPLLAAESGLKHDGWIMCDKTRSITRSRLIKKIGTVPPKTLLAVSDALAWIIGLQ